MDTNYYRDTLVMEGHLNNATTYAIVEDNEDVKVFRKLGKLIKKYENCLTRKESKYISDFAWQSSNLYVLPKIHKSKAIIEAMERTNDCYIHMKPPSDLKARPIVAGPL